MTWKKRIKHPSKLVQIGDPVDIVILDVDEDSRRISLGMKQTEPNPWRLIAEKYHEGQVITGRVRNLTDFGAFVEIEDGIDGLIHISDMSWTKRVEHPSEVLQKGQEVEVAVLNVDVERQRLSLGLKQLKPERLGSVRRRPTRSAIRSTARRHEADQLRRVRRAGGGPRGPVARLGDLGSHHVKDPADELKVGEPSPGADPQDRDRLAEDRANAA